MTAEQITLEMLESRDDLKQAILREHAESESVKVKSAAQEAEIKTLREENAKFKAAEALESRKATVDKAIAEAKLPEAVVTESFKQLCYDSTEETLPKLIAEWQGIAKGIKSAAGKPLSKAQHEATESRQSTPEATAAKYRA